MQLVDASQHLPPFTVDKPHPPKNHVTVPLKVLQTVFSLATEHRYDDVDFAEQKILQATVFACSQVCRHWRAAARGCSPLWVHVVDFQRHPIDAIQEFLRLSSPHDIHVGHRSAPFRIYRARDVFVLNILKPHVRRIREWNVEFKGRGATQSWVLGSQASSKLNTFRWAGLFSSSAGLLQPPASPFVNTSIHQLSLRDSNFPLSRLASLLDLTELSVSNMILSRLTAGEWVALLRRTPRLQFLSLHNAVALGGHRISQLEPRVKLPHLRFVSLGDEEHLAPMIEVFLLIEPLSFFGVEIDIPRRKSNRKPNADSTSPSDPVPYVSIESHFRAGGQTNVFLHMHWATIRMTVGDPSFATILHPELFKASVPSILLEIGDLVTTLVLDEGAILSVLPAITGTLIPRSRAPTGLSSGVQMCRPILPEFKQLVLDENVVLYDSRQLVYQVLRGFVRWRGVVGYPVDVLDCRRNGVVLV